LKDLKVYSKKVMMMTKRTEGMLPAMVKRKLQNNNAATDVTQSSGAYTEASFR
jgi:hypothetical protein